MQSTEELYEGVWYGGVVSGGGRGGNVRVVLGSNGGNACSNNI